jgi:hypothetical protein
VPYSVRFTYPGATYQALEAHCSCPTLSYKRLRYAPLLRGRRKKRLRQGRLEYNTTQFSRGRRVLRSGDPNHVNLRVHRVHLELTTKKLKSFTTKEPQRAAPERLRWKCRKTTLIFDAPGRGAWCFSGSKASTTPSHRPHDDVVASQPEARGGCCSATTSPSPCSHASSLPQTSLCSDSCSTRTE